jgi:hypothetical protein
MNDMISSKRHFAKEVYIPNAEGRKGKVDSQAVSLHYLVIAVQRQTRFPLCQNLKYFFTGDGSKTLQYFNAKKRFSFDFSNKNCFEKYIYLGGD